MVASVDEIVFDSVTYAICIRSNFTSDGIAFFTPPTFSQQLGYMNRPMGYEIPPHIHNPVQRQVLFTKEVLFVRSGLVRVDFYDDNQTYLKSINIAKGDVLLLANGGHGFKMLEPSEIIEVKQGPYVGEDDKTRFSPVSNSQVRY